MTIGEFINRRRIELGLTLEDIGKATGVGKSTVKKWETGYISNMRRDKIEDLANILKVSPVVFIDNSINDYDEAIKCQTSSAISETQTTADPDQNTVILAARGGGIIKRKLTNEQIELLEKMIQQMPETDEDL